jgi:hypothetical protein
MKGKIDISEGDKYSYTVDGRELYLRFVGVNKDVT